MKEKLKRVLHQRHIHPVLAVINRHLPASMASTFHSLGAYPAAPDPRLPSLERVFEQIATRGIEGDYLEFGVYYGKSFRMACQLAGKNRLKDMRFFAFDGFQGLPASDEVHGKGGLRASRQRFTAYVRQAGIDMRRVKVVEGLYRDSLNGSVKETHELKRAAVVHVNSDLYESAADALRFVEDLVHTGSIIVFGGWRAFETKLGIGTNEARNFGEQKAFYEWPLSGCCERFLDTEWVTAFALNQEPPPESAEKS